MSNGSETTAAPVTPRAQAYSIILRFRKAYGKGQGLKAEAMVSEALARGSAYSAQDRAFLKVLVTGVLRYWIQLDAVIERLSDFPLKRIEHSVMTLLQLGLYQLRYLDSVPDYAAMDTTVELAKDLGLSAKSVAFLNGMLRSAQRQPEVFDFDEPALRYSVPQWFLELLSVQYDQTQLSEILEALKTPPPLCLRVNTSRISLPEYSPRLDEAGVAYEQSAEFPDEVLMLKGFYGHPAQLPGYADGLFYVQDFHSLHVAPSLIEKGFSGLIVDLCAAPGSKATHLAERMGDGGKIIAIEPVEKRAERLRENIVRLGHQERIEVWCQKGQDVALSEGGLVDAILVDAPCSGLGTVRRHPEILLQLKPENFGQYQDLQLALLEKAINLLKPGGRLLYSTCSILPQENDELISRLLIQHPEMVLQTSTELPLGVDGDGFFISVLEKQH